MGSSAAGCPLATHGRNHFASGAECESERPTPRANPVCDRSAAEVPRADSWWARRDSNPQPRDYESPALTVELQARTLFNSSQTKHLRHPCRYVFLTLWRLGAS